MSYTPKERKYYNEYRERVCQFLGISKNQYNLLRRKGEQYRLACEEIASGHKDTILGKDENGYYIGYFETR